MKTLFCTDGSKISFNSINNFLNWSKSGLIDIICVIDWDFLPEDIDLQQSDFNVSCSNLADNILTFAESELLKKGVKLNEKFKMCGDIVDLILEKTNTSIYDVVIVGSHGKKGFQKWLGSISYELMNNSKTPIYISKHKNECKKLLIAVNDKTDTIENIKEQLLKMNLDNKEIHICMVNENPNLLFLDGTLDSNWFLKIEQQQDKHAQKIIEVAETTLKHIGINNFKSSILKGIPAQEIIKYSNDKNIDLIILDSKYKEKRSKLFAHQTSKRICENVLADVLVIK